jgi:hypothetical protein
VLFEFVDHVDESVGNISFGSGVISVLDFEGGFLVIGGFVVISHSFSIDGLSWVFLSELVESFHGFLVEDMGIG